MSHLPALARPSYLQGCRRTCTAVDGLAALRTEHIAADQDGW
jgi:hypothetical protein